MILSALIVLAIALMMPVQTSLNSRLSEGLKSSFIAALVSFIVGSAALCSWLFIAGNGQLLPDGIFAELPWWAWIGGCAGVLGIVANIILFPKLGSVQTVLLVMFGQVFAGIMVDTFGWFEAPVLPFTLMRLAGLILAVVGVCIVVVAPKQKREEAKNGMKMLPYQILGLVGGIAFGLQPSFNNKLGMALASPVKASTISFLTGMILLVVLVLLIGQHRRQIGNIRHARAPWWCWLGGLIGAASVWSGAAFAEQVGFAVFTIITIFGMLLSSSLIDHLGLFGAIRRRLTLRHIVGLALVFAGMLLI